MIWKNVRLELAGSADFPRGSPSRAYLLRLPLDDDGSIDTRAVCEQPRRATIRRFWPSQPDQTGYVSPASGGLEITYELSRTGTGTGRLEGEALRLGDCLTLTEPDGTSLLYRVAALDTVA